mgnify:CR=1 FL=1
MRKNDFLRSGLKITTLFASALLAVCVSGQPAPKTDNSVTIGADNPSILYSGRSEGIGTSKVTFGYSGARVRLRFVGSSVGMLMDDGKGANYAMAWIDGQPGKKFQLNARDGFYPLAQGLKAGEHTVEVVRVTECFLGLTSFRGFVLNHGARALPWGESHDRRIEFIGDSITCGYGVEVDDPKLHFEPATENYCLGYSALAAKQLDADTLVVARSGIGILRNYDGPRDGSKDAMPQIYPHTFYLQAQPEWDFNRFTPDVVCVNLGTNDFSTTGVNVEKFVASYVDFGTMLLKRYPHAQLLILQGPMDTGKALRAALDRVVGQLHAQASERVHFLALSPMGSAGYGADSHPNRAQSEINSAELTTYLSDLMKWR